MGVAPKGHRRLGPGEAAGAVSRRAFLASTMAGAAGVALAACGGGSTSPSTTSTTTGTTSAKSARGVGIPPNPKMPVGSDQLPEVDHIVVVMMENHSFDNILGSLGRGDVLSRNSAGVPDATNPDGQGHLIRSFSMPNPCQVHGKPAQDWNASHTQYAGGTNQGFVVSSSGPVAMGYFTAADLPFTNSLAATYPIADRYFCSVLAQTAPNRRYLLAGTSLGLINDTYPLALPPNGTIFDSLERHGISWRNYYSDTPSSWSFLGLATEPSNKAGIAHVSQFYADCASGSLPAFSLVDPDFNMSSEENPQDVQYGDVFLSKVVDAVTSGPKWSKTMLIWNYDEHGGYYDHVPPPAAVTPDDIPPMLSADNVPGAFDRLGFRVPAGVVSPYARKNHVSHTVYDHTSVLRTVEVKWNLPALTRRDAAANDLFDMVDFSSPPAFLHPPRLHAPADPAAKASCLVSGPGTIPPPNAVIAAR
jgi:phospholipase C